MFTLLPWWEPATLEVVRRYDDAGEGLGTMWILGETELKKFYRRHPDSRGPLVAWIKEIEAARYRTPAQVRARHGSADFVKDKVIFDIGGTKYRLIVRFRYGNPSAVPPLNGIARVLFIGTHAEYDALDVAAL
jgi:mRNA interferase HigB